MLFEDSLFERILNFFMYNNCCSTTGISIYTVQGFHLTLCGTTGISIYSASLILVIGMHAGDIFHNQNSDALMCIYNRIVAHT